jgi:hypothetical protein
VEQRDHVERSGLFFVLSDLLLSLALSWIKGKC